MDVTTNNYYEAPPPSPPLFVSQQEATKNPFLDTFAADPLCKLNLKETSEFVKSFPVAYNGGAEGKGILEFSSSSQSRKNAATKRNIEAPSTPGRPIFSFSVGNFSRKACPSKWDDAEKWLVNGTSCNDSPVNYHAPLKPSESVKISQKVSKAEVFGEKSRVNIEEKVSKVVSGFHESLNVDHHNSAGAFNGISSVSTDVLLKDKFTNEVKPTSPNLKCSEPMKEGFVFGNAAENLKRDDATDVLHKVKHKDVGTEMTPIGSSTTSRCHTPFKSSSPARHNTPANRSGPLAIANISGSDTLDMKILQECHLAKLQLGSQFDSVTSNWSSREEEEEDISKSLRHFEINNEFRKSVSESRACAWKEEEKNNCCLSYQREEAKIQAWVNLQNAKAEAQSRKLEVKIQKMRLNLEEKLMKKMAIVHEKAEEWRAAAQFQHSQQIQKVTEQAQKMMMMKKKNSHFAGQRSSCGCFPCNNHHK